MECNVRSSQGRETGSAWLEATRLLLTHILIIIAIFIINMESGFEYRIHIILESFDNCMNCEFWN